MITRVFHFIARENRTGLTNLLHSQTNETHQVREALTEI
jgi:hypothetical protein